jgi:exosortase/archaeosortase family protein
MQLILDWDRYHFAENMRFSKPRLFAFCAFVFLPTLYVILSNFLGLNSAIFDFAVQRGIVFPGESDPYFWARLMPLSTEYLVFTVLFAAILLSVWGRRGLIDFSPSIGLIGAVGIIYTIDNIFPNGEFTPFQFFVPATATLASFILSFMGYRVSLSTAQSMPKLVAFNQNGVFGANIAWPCSGVESFVIYTIVAILFLKITGYSWKEKLAYFGIGAIVTYLINILRIASIYVIGVNSDGVTVMRFHDYYAQLLSILWIAVYPLLIIGTKILFEKMVFTEIAR